jgi:hypothetical protein
MQKGRHKMNWEYQIVNVSVENPADCESCRYTLNQLGAQGWEAVTAWAETNRRSVVLLKRQKSK